jgi:predicted thioredoxin/glutaredoxin
MTYAPSNPQATPRKGFGVTLLWLLLADSVEKVGLAAACRSGVPAVEVTASHFRLPFGVSLSVLAQA